MPRSFFRMKPNAAARNRWSALSPAAPLRPAAAWAMPARSSPAARATPSPRSRPWKRPASKSRRRRRGSARRWLKYGSDQGQNSSFARPRRWAFRPLARREKRCDLSDHERRATTPAAERPASLRLAAKIAAKRLAEIMSFDPNPFLARLDAVAAETEAL